MDSHAMSSNYSKKVSKLLEQLPKYLEDNKKLRLKKKNSNLFRHRQSATDHGLDLNSFNTVIRIDPDNLIAEAEGLVTYEKLVKETLKYHCLPAIVPELKSITMGGAIAGLGAESSSFKFGWVHETVLTMDVLLGHGQVVTCSANNAYSDLFYAFPSSYGTLGYVLKATIRLIPVKPYIKLSRLYFKDPIDYFKKLQELTDLKQDAQKIDYIDGVGLGDDLSITLGTFVDRAPYTSHYQYMNIYYQSIPEKKEDYLTTSDYIWRWDSDWFWCSKYFLMQQKWLRLLLGKWMLKSTVYWRLMHFVNTNRAAKLIRNLYGKQTETIIQDLQIPIEHAIEFYHFFKTDIGINPMLICPIKRNPQFNDFLFCKMRKNHLYINFGAYGDFIPSDKPAGYFNRLIEDKVKSLQGNKWLYSSVFYSKKDFWTIYDETSYLAMKEKYDPKNRLNNIYEKCCNSSLSQ